MATNRFTHALEEGRKSNAGSTWSRQIERRHEQINDMIEEVRAAIDLELGDDGSARIEPWLRTSEGDGQRLIVSGADGLVFQLFTVSVPLPGYPVTLRVRGDVSQAGDLNELERELQKVVKHPDVTAAVEYVIDGAADQ